MGHREALMLLAALCLLSSSVAAAVISPNSFVRSQDLVVALRGGGTDKKTKRKQKTKSKANKKDISDAMKEKDAAEALGDAIRDRADDLRKQDPFLDSIDGSISSLGHAMGASDHRMSEGGGVETATSSVVANYFLKSHGGAHGLQFACSFLATLSGLGVFAFTPKKPQLAFVLLQRTLIFAMIKHISGVLAAASIAAKAVPKIGLGHARQWMEKIVLDPVSQYVFYTALLLLWLPAKTNLDACWWWKRSTLFKFMIVGPILVREIISNILVISDILVLWSVSSQSAIGESILKVSNSIINAVMSLLVSANKWRSADPSSRQAILAKVVSQITLGMEFSVGVIMLLDFLWTFSTTVFGSAANRPTVKETLVKGMCIRLYVHFLWIRKSKLSKLATTVRGGASKVPFWFFDILDHPIQSMGLENSTENGDSWRDQVATALGLDQ